MFIVSLARFCRLERLVGVPNNVVRLVVDPVGAARTAVTDRGELAVVAELAVDVAILSWNRQNCYSNSYSNNRTTGTTVATDQKGARKLV